MATRIKSRLAVPLALLGLAAALSTNLNAQTTVVDNTDSGFQTTGSWLVSTFSNQYIGTNFVHDNNAEKGSKVATYSANLSAGSHEVFINYTSHSNRASNVPVTINHSGGATTVVVDQRSGGGTWQSLGTFNFASSSSNQVEISNAGTNGFVVADAIAFEYLGEGGATEEIVDNDSPGVQVNGSWPASTAISGYIGADYLHDNNNGKGSKSVVYPVNLGSGDIEVYINYVGGGNRASNVPVDIHRAGGVTTVTVDQRNGGGQWQYLGTFDSVSQVTIRNTGTNGFVIADAFRFVSSGGGGGLSDEQIIAAGLVAWNKPDGDGISCAECHTPFGYDVAIFDFDQEDLRRATAPHLTDDDADDIFAMIEVLRDWYPPEDGLKDVETFRPFQPGGDVLGGVHASLQDRDDAFALHLKNEVNLRIAQSAPITTLAVANQALNELQDLDLAQLPIGIKLNRWSEAVSRSGMVEGGRIAEWLPGMGLQPMSQHESEWMDLVDAYVAYPSDENFWNFFHKIDLFLDFDPVNSAPLDSKANRWMRMTKDIYKSNNVFAHNELNKAIGSPELQFTDGIQPFPDQIARRQSELDNNAHMGFIWEVGDMARQLDGGGSFFDQMPLRHQETLYNAGGNAWKDRITDLRTTWMWIGFTHNPVMLHSGGGNSTRSLEYTMNWGARPNRSHYAFANAALVTKRGFHLAESESGDFILGQFSNFFAYGRYRDHTWDTTPGAWEVYQALIANFHRAALIRKTHEINTHGRHWRAENLLLNTAESLRVAMNWADPANETLNEQIVDAFILAVQSHPQ